jgi:hypothetical protein
MSQHKAQCGFVTFALNSETVNYLELAYLQCLNVKATQPTNNLYAVIVDSATEQLLTDKHRQVFDYIIPLPIGKVENPFGAEPAVWRLTPFKETIKLESDLLFTRSIEHWWTAFRLKDVCMPVGAKMYTDACSAIRRYRELFDANNLPDVYNGLMYFRFSYEAMTFFNIATLVFTQWQDIKHMLQEVDLDLELTTDLAYAITALMIGEETVTMPSMDFLNFVHMKSGFNGWSDARTWMETVVNERDGDIIRINNLNQYSPVHYHDKNYCTRELIEYYEQRVLA